MHRGPYIIAFIGVFCALLCALPSRLEAADETQSQKLAALKALIASAAKAPPESIADVRQKLAAAKQSFKTDFKEQDPAESTPKEGAPGKQPGDPQHNQNFLDESERAELAGVESDLDAAIAKLEPKESGQQPGETPPDPVEELPPAEAAERKAKVEETIDRILKNRNYDERKSKVEARVQGFPNPPAAGVPLKTQAEGRLTNIATARANLAKAEGNLVQARNAYRDTGKKRELDQVAKDARAANDALVKLESEANKYSEAVRDESWEKFTGKAGEVDRTKIENGDKDAIAGIVKGKSQKELEELRASLAGSFLGGAESKAIKAFDEARFDTLSQSTDDKPAPLQKAIEANPEIAADLKSLAEATAKDKEKLALRLIGNLTETERKAFAEALPQTLRDSLNKSKEVQQAIKDQRVIEKALADAKIEDRAVMATAMKLARADKDSILGLAQDLKKQATPKQFDQFMKGVEGVGTTKDFSRAIAIATDDGAMKKLAELRGGGEAGVDEIARAQKLSRDLKLTKLGKEEFAALMKTAYDDAPIPEVDALKAYHTVMTEDAETSVKNMMASMKKTGTDEAPLEMADQVRQRVFAEVKAKLDPFLKESLSMQDYTSAMAYTLRTDFEKPEDVQDFVLGLRNGISSKQRAALGAKLRELTKGDSEFAKSLRAGLAAIDFAERLERGERESTAIAAIRKNYSPEIANALLGVGDKGGTYSREVARVAEFDRFRKSFTLDKGKLTINNSQDFLTGREKYAKVLTEFAVLKGDEKLLAAASVNLEMDANTKQMKVIIPSADSPIRVAFVQTSFLPDGMSQGQMKLPGAPQNTGIAGDRPIVAEINLTNAGALKGLQIPEGVEIRSVDETQMKELPNPRKLKVTDGKLQEEAEAPPGDVESNPYDYIAWFRTGYQRVKDAFRTSPPNAARVDRFDTVAATVGPRANARAARREPASQRPRPTKPVSEELRELLRR